MEGIPTPTIDSLYLEKYPWRYLLLSWVPFGAHHSGHHESWILIQSDVVVSAADLSLIDIGML